MIRIVVDSAADCSSFPEVYDHLVPLTVTVGEKDYLDGVELRADRFYELLTSGEEFPKTSQPSPEAYFGVFRKAKKAGDDVLCFTVSSALSGTYQSATIAKEMVDYDRIYIIDSCAASHLIALLAEYARKRIQEGAAAEQIAVDCEALKSRIRVFAGLDTLEYLQKGGRLGKASAAVGQIAGIKPIVTFTQDGLVSLCGKSIGVPRAIASIISKVQQDQIDTDFPVYSLYTSGVENVRKLEEKLEQAGISVSEPRQVGPTIGSHVGPGVYGVIYVVKE